MTELTPYAEWLVAAYAARKHESGDPKYAFVGNKPRLLSDAPPATIIDKKVDTSSTFKAFKEQFTFEQCLKALTSTWLFDCSDSVWKVDHLCDKVGNTAGLTSQVSWAQFLAGFENLWTDSRLRSTSPNDESKQRFMVPCALPVAAPSTASVEVLARRHGGGEAVVMRELPLLAGHSVIWSFVARCAQICEQIFGEVEEGASYSSLPAEFLDQGAEKIMDKLFECSLTTSLRYRSCADAKVISGDVLDFGETIRILKGMGEPTYWQWVFQLSQRYEELRNPDWKDRFTGPKLLETLKSDGVTFEGKTVPLAAARSLNVVAEFAINPKAFQAMVMLDNACTSLKVPNSFNAKTLSYRRPPA